MKKYMNPMAEITMISAEDILTTSTPDFLQLNDHAAGTPSKSDRVGNEDFWG